MMIDPKHIDLVTAYLDGSITTEQRHRLDELVEKGAVDRTELNEMKVTYRQIGVLPAPDPSDGLRSSFYSMLEAEKRKHSHNSESRVQNWIGTYFTVNGLRRLGLAAVIFLMGLLAGNLLTPFQDYREQMADLSQEVSEMRKIMMLSLLDARSPSERLKAVNISSEITSADQRIVEALLKTLHNDPNVNVRLASIEALLHHAENPEARKGLVDALTSRQSPQVLVALADAMLALQENRSIDDLRRLLKRQELDTTVRNKLLNTIAGLS